MNSSELIIISTLASLNVLQLLFWMRETHRLIDKIMCRNYGEYVQLQKSTPEIRPKMDEFHVDEKEVLEELNSLLR